MTPAAGGVSPERLEELAYVVSHYLHASDEIVQEAAAHLRRLAALDEAGGGRAYTLMLEQRLKEEADRLAALERDHARLREALDTATCFGTDRQRQIAREALGGAADEPEGA